MKCPRLYSQIFEKLSKFSDLKYQSIKNKKIQYIHMSKFPLTRPIECSDGSFIRALNDTESASYLGMYLIHTSSLQELNRFNIDKRMFKYIAWLEVNTNPPFSVKMQVLDNCVLSAIVYGCEVWGDLSFMAKKLKTIELDMLKSALRVQKGTPSDLVHHELNRSDKNI